MARKYHSHKETFLCARKEGSECHHPSGIPYQSHGTSLKDKLVSLILSKAIPIVKMNACWIRLKKFRLENRLITIHILRVIIQ